MSETPMPKTREELRDLIADARPAHFENLRVGRPFANAVLSALDKAGLAIVPKEPTKDMERVGTVEKEDAPEYGEPVLVNEIYRAMLSASPFAVKP